MKRFFAMLLKNPILIGYTIFIAIVILIYAASELFNFPFDDWKRIVGATTFSSYFFTIANAFRSLMTQEKNRSEVYYAMLQRTKDYAFFATSNEVVLTKDFCEHIKEKTKPIIDGLDDLYNDSVKNYKKNEIIFGILSVIGFVVFLLAISITAIYELIASSLELYTMLAFLVMFATEQPMTVVSDVDKKYKDTINKTLSDIVEVEKFVYDFNMELKMNELDKTIQEAENGQDEDGE